MFLKSLTIVRGDGAIIRDIRFHTGLNLIVDETPVSSGKETGNNVGAEKRTRQEIILQVAEGKIDGKSWRHTVPQSSILTNNPAPLELS